MEPLWFYLAASVKVSPARQAHKWRDRQAHWPDTFVAPIACLNGSNAGTGGRKGRHFAVGGCVDGVRKRQTFTVSGNTEQVRGCVGLQAGSSAGSQASTSEKFNCSTKRVAT